jgi:hypothetical protein
MENKVADGIIYPMLCFASIALLVSVLRVTSLNEGELSYQLLFPSIDIHDTCNRL